MSQPTKTVSGQYSVRCCCDNCGNEERVQIPRGTLIGERVCMTCGCKTLKKALFSTGYKVSD